MGKQKSRTLNVYPNIQIAQPGRHASETVPPGGDFVVRVTDPNIGWEYHEFTHTDIFKDIEKKRTVQVNPALAVMRDYLAVIKGGEIPETPEAYTMTLVNIFDYGLDVWTFLQAVQVLAVAEHRRYKRYERQFGGRFLPFRFAAGIAEGLWTAADAATLQKKGRPGVEILEKAHGKPLLTQELMK